MRQLPTDVVFSRDEARALGVSDSALTRAAAAGRIVRLRRGLFVVGAASELVVAQAAARAVDGSAISHRSGLLVHGLPRVGRAPGLPELTVPPDGTGDTRTAALHRAALPAEHVTSIRGYRVTTPPRTVVDVARNFPLITAIAAIDAALNRGLATPDELDSVVLRCWNWPGIGRAQRAIRLSDRRAESPLESISRLAIDRLRVPTPDLQPTILDQYGRMLGRLDFYWDEFGVAGEADGRMKYADRDGQRGGDVLVAEKERQELLEDAGLIFVRWGWEQVSRRPAALRARIEAAFVRGAARDRSGLPRLWSVVPSEPARPRANPIG